MSWDYDDYLNEHVKAVQRAVSIFGEIGVLSPTSDLYLQVVNLARDHDESKYEQEEYDAYDLYFYKKKAIDDEKERKAIDIAFDCAWLHHIHWNPHHWQHWILIEDNGKPKALEIPEKYVYEMIADWWSFSLRNEKPKEIFDWYQEHKGKMLLHPETRKLVESIMDKLWTYIEKEEAKGLG